MGRILRNPPLLARFGVACPSGSVTTAEVLAARGLRFLRCRDVPERVVSGGPGVVADLTLSFGPDGRLIGVDALRTRLDAHAAGGRHERLSLGLRDALGAATESAPASCATASRTTWPASPP